LRREIGGRGVGEQLLHGEPHPGNGRRLQGGHRRGVRSACGVRLGLPHVRGWSPAPLPTDNREAAAPGSRCPRPRGGNRGPSYERPVIPPEPAAGAPSGETG
jgi:hypothetical protein